MNFFNTITHYFKNVISNNNENQKQDIEKTITDLNLKLEKLTHSLVELVFQEKKYIGKKSSYQNELVQIKLDIEDSIRNNDDDLSMLLLDKADQTNEEISFVKDQLSTLSSDIVSLKENKKELQIGIKRYKDVLITYDSKMKALKARKDIFQEVNAIKAEVSSLSSESTLTKIKDKIAYMNIEMNIDTGENASIEQRLLTNRKHRLNTKNMDRLQKLKDQLNKNLNQNVVVVK
jgi:phage shock protein A